MDGMGDAIHICCSRWIATSTYPNNTLTPPERYTKKAGDLYRNKTAMEETDGKYIQFLKARDSKSGVWSSIPSQSFGQTKSTISILATSILSKTNAQWHHRYIPVVRPYQNKMVFVAHIPHHDQGDGVMASPLKPPKNYSEFPMRRDISHTQP